MANLLRQSNPKPSSSKTQAHFRFLELPAELRWYIYEEVILGNLPLVLSRNHSSLTNILAPIFALAQVNKQIRQEYLNLVNDRAITIRTEVRNWDFGHVIRFLNQITKEKREQASDKVSILRDHELHIDFWFSGENADPGGLLRWLKRFELEDDDVVEEEEEHKEKASSTKPRIVYACGRTKYVEQNWSVAGFRACTVGGSGGHKEYMEIKQMLCSKGLDLGEI